MLSHDQAVVMLAALASAADGQPSAEEDRAIAVHLAPVLKRLGPGGQREAMTLLRQLLDGVGRDNTLSALRNALLTPRDRLEAVRLAATLVYSDGMVTREEADHVAELALAMGLSEKEFAALLRR